MTNNVKEDARIDDVAEAVKAIRHELTADLPKMRRKGKLLIDGQTVEVEPVGELIAV